METQLHSVQLSLSSSMHHYEQAFSVRPSVPSQSALSKILFSLAHVTFRLPWDEAEKTEASYIGVGLQKCTHMQRVEKSHCINV